MGRAGRHRVLSYDDLHNATRTLRRLWDYGTGSAPDLTAEERELRRATMAQVANALIGATTIERMSGSAFAIDATGQWAWHLGDGRGKRKLQQAAAGKTGEELDDLIVEGIAFDDDGSTAPADQDAPVPAKVRSALHDAAWGYKTGKDGPARGGACLGYVNKQNAARIAKRLDAGEDLVAITLSGSPRGQADDPVTVLITTPELLAHLRR